MKHFFTFFVLFAALLAVGAGCTKSNESPYELNEAEGDTESVGEHELNEAEGDSMSYHELNEAEGDPESVGDHELNEATGDEDEPVTWSSYMNPRYEYTLSYPSNWYFTPDACCPPPPTFVVFNNVSDVFFEFTPVQWNEGICSFSVLCGYEGTLDTISELQSRIADGETYSEVSINGYPAAQMASGGYYVVDGTNGCRINSSGGCSEITSILNSFSF